MSIPPKAIYTRLYLRNRDSVVLLDDSFQPVSLCEDELIVDKTVRRERNLALPTRIGGLVEPWLVVLHKVSWVDESINCDDVFHPLHSLKMGRDDELKSLRQLRNLSNSVRCFVADKQTFEVLLRKCTREFVFDINRGRHGTLNKNASLHERKSQLDDRNDSTAGRFSSGWQQEQGGFKRIAEVWVMIPRIEDAGRSHQDPGHMLSNVPEGFI
mmetsp:Transcript_40366/g.54934  ORF Transcript_40366/g.54934 Transcript_40366/m.54934 type:complete len:213 (-) Transcript_40366:40-678(-)